MTPKNLVCTIPAAVSLAVAAALAPVQAAAQERQFVYCVSSAPTPGGKAYFTAVFPGTWDDAVASEDAYFDHVSRRLDEGVDRSTTYCYVLDSFDEAGLDRQEGVSIARNQGWKPVDITWRP